MQEEESQAVRENATSFEASKTNEEQSRESVDTVNIKTPNVMGSSTQPVEGVERVELVAGDKSTVEAPKEESMEKVTLKKKKQKDSENYKTVSQKEEGMEKVTLRSTKQKEKEKEVKSKDSTSTTLEAPEPAAAWGKKENKLGESRETQASNSDLGTKDAENVIKLEEQSVNSDTRKEQVRKIKKETSEEPKEKQIHKEKGTTDISSDMKRAVGKEEKASGVKRPVKEIEKKTDLSSSSPSSSSSNDSEKKVEPMKKLSHSTSREEDKIQIKVPERREIDTSQKTAPIQKDDSTELKYVVEEPTEERERTVEKKKKQLDVVEIQDDQTGVSEKMSSFTVQEPETPDSPDIRKEDLPEEPEPRKEETPTKGKLQPKVTEDKSVTRQTPSQTQSPMPKIHAETEPSKTSRDYKTEHIKMKPQEREVAR